MDVVEGVPLHILSLVKSSGFKTKKVYVLDQLKLSVPNVKNNNNNNNLSKVKYLQLAGEHKLLHNHLKNSKEPFFTYFF